MQAQVTLSPQVSPRDAGSRRIRRRDVLAGTGLLFFLLVLLLLLMAWSVQAARWVNSGLNILYWVVLTGAAIGAALALVGWRGRYAHPYALIVGTAWVLLLTATTVPGDAGLFEKLRIIWEHTLSWVTGAISGRPLADSLVFVLQVAFLSWWLAYLAAWAVFRQGRVWRAIIPLGLVMLVNAYYYNGRQDLRPAIVLFLVFALLLIIRAQLTQEEGRWHDEGVRYSRDISFDFLRDGAIFAITVILLAWVMPNAATGPAVSTLVEPFEGTWETVRQEWTRLFGSLNYQPSSLAGAFGRSMTLSGPRSLSDRIVMDVQAPQGNYWRGVTFDTYNGRQWLNSEADTITLEPDDTSVLSAPYAARKTMTETVTTYLRGETVLFSAPQPLRASQAVRADVAYLSASDANAALFGIQNPANAKPVEIARMRTRQPFKEGDSYQVVSAVTTADVETLRQTSTNYPSYVRERYLQLPDTLPERVRTLAQQITQDSDNNYDRAVAIQDYLRREIKYNEKIAAPPEGVDGVDYVLFQSKEGYCDYYASAMAVMARSVGIPARIVAGYAQGDFEPELGVYRVREANAHSWVEVFFPALGWIEFEPTAAQPSIVRPKPADSQTQNDESALLAEQNRQTRENLLEQEDKFGQADETPGEFTGGIGTSLASLPTAGRLGFVVLGLVLVAAVGYGIVRLRGRRQTRPVQVDPELSLRLYERLERWASRVGLGRRPSQTPFEHAAMLSQTVPDGAAPIQHITATYVREQFSPSAVPPAELGALSGEWLKLQPVLRRYWNQYRTRLPVLERFKPARW